MGISEPHSAFLLRKRVQQAIDGLELLAAVPRNASHRPAPDNLDGEPIPGTLLDYQNAVARSRLAAAVKALDQRSLAATDLDERAGLVDLRSALTSMQATLSRHQLGPRHVYLRAPSASDLELPLPVAAPQPDVAFAAYEAARRAVVDAERERDRVILGRLCDGASGDSIDRDPAVRQATARLLWAGRAASRVGLPPRGPTKQEVEAARRIREDWADVIEQWGVALATLRAWGEADRPAATTSAAPAPQPLTSSQLGILQAVIDNPGVRREELVKAKLSISVDGINTQVSDIRKRGVPLRKQGSTLVLDGPLPEVVRRQLEGQKLSKL